MQQADETSEGPLLLTSSRKAPVGLIGPTKETAYHAWAAVAATEGGGTLRLSWLSDLERLLDSSTTEQDGGPWLSFFSCFCENNLGVSWSQVWPPGTPFAKRQHGRVAAPLC